jgi:hypothetical protein
MPNFNIYLIVYVIIACFVTIKYTYTLNQSGDAVTAFFFFIGATIPQAHPQLFSLKQKHYLNL